jgi:phosphopantothenoylcysteine decarboxylase/phosphopantothenate--cysteine ligase
MSNSNKKQKNILFQLTGSVAAFKACSVISGLVQKKYQVQVVTSASALKFVGPATLEGLTGRSVLHDTFEPGQMMNHINLARWADTFVLCPATASAINRLAHGLGDDLIGSIFLAQDFRKPYLVFPAMNSNMLEHPATRESISKLKAMGVRIFPTEKGILACGEFGPGKLMNPDLIVDEISRFAVNSTAHLAFRKLRILVTAGGTAEPIDNVRFISNRSSGQTGCQIADALADVGHKIVLLRSRTGASAKSNGDLVSHDFESCEDLRKLLIDHLGNHSFDAIIHSAAVSDFTVDTIVDQTGRFCDHDQKISSDGNISINLKKNPKLIRELRHWSVNKSILVIGFKLTSTHNIEDRLNSLKKLQQEASPDFVVLNDLSDISEQSHIFSIYKDETICKSGNTKSDLELAIIQLLSQSEVHGI